MWTGFIWLRIGFCKEIMKLLQKPILSPVHILKPYNFDVHFNPLTFHLRLGCPVVVVVEEKEKNFIPVRHRTLFLGLECHEGIQKK
jgi:hypothetical protein